MNMKWVSRWAVLVLAMACAGGAAADDREDYNRRAATRDVALFHALDRDADGAVTRLEAQGDVNFLPRFDDMETDMNGAVTMAELRRYIEKQYGTAARTPTDFRAPPAAKP